MKYGTYFALFSTLLSSLAQLFMYFGMQKNVTIWSIMTQEEFSEGCLFVLIGILIYFLSTICWTFSLRELPLSKAYTLLTLSYPIVYLSSVFFQSTHETLQVDAEKILGIFFIIIGVVLIYQYSAIRNKICLGDSL